MEREYHIYIGVMNMNDLQARVLFNYPVLYDCVCHIREEMPGEDTSSIIIDTNNKLVKLTEDIRDLSIVLRKQMEGCYAT
jgi:hypothetical protein